MAFFEITGTPRYVCSCGRSALLESALARELMTHKYRATPCTSEIEYCLVVWQEDAMFILLPTLGG